jgi:predicted  nucleic acid-binding Zn-ribbon protein
MTEKDLQHDTAEMQRQLAQLKEERDYLLAHTQNLEVELRRVALEPARIRDLEQRLADAEARLRRVSAVHMAKWLVLEPDVAAKRIYRRLRDGLAWRTRRRLRALGLRDRSSGA